QALIYERRFGKRLQVEGAARTVFDSLRRPFDGVTASLKYNVWHSLERRALASLGVEATPPLGRQETWEIEPFVSFGANPGALVLQGEVVASWEEAAGVTAFSYRLGVGREVGRVVPMLDAGWTVPRAGQRCLSIRSCGCDSPAWAMWPRPSARRSGQSGPSRAVQDSLRSCSGTTATRRYCTGGRGR